MQIKRKPCKIYKRESLKINTTIVYYVNKFSYILFLANGIYLQKYIYNFALWKKNIY